MLEYEDMANPDGKYQVDDLLAVHEKEDRKDSNRGPSLTMNRSKAQSPSTRSSPSSLRRSMKPDVNGKVLFLSLPLLRLMIL